MFIMLFIVLFFLLFYMCNVESSTSYMTNLLTNLLTKRQTIYMNIFSITIIIVYVLYASMERILDGKYGIISKILSIFVFIITLWKGINRDTYLTFLSPTVFPYTLIKDPGVQGTHSQANVHTTINVAAPDGTKIAFWGALSSDTVQATPQEAYKDYSNAGVCVVQGGKAQLSFFCPSKYTVPWGKTLDRHIHYRIVNDDGMLSSVKTVYVNC